MLLEFASPHEHIYVPLLNFLQVLLNLIRRNLLVHHLL